MVLKFVGDHWSEKKAAYEGNRSFCKANIKAMFILTKVKGCIAIRTIYRRVSVCILSLLWFKMFLYILETCDGRSKSNFSMFERFENAFRFYSMILKVKWSQRYVRFSIFFRHSEILQRLSGLKLFINLPNLISITRPILWLISRYLLSPSKRMYITVVKNYLKKASRSLYRRLMMRNLNFDVSCSRK